MIISDDLNTVVGTGDQYYLSASDVGRQMYFEVSFTDNDGFAESALYTGPSQNVQEAPPVNTPAEFTGLGITGEFTEGSILTADYQITDANGWSGVADVSWYHSDDLYTVVGTGSSYILSASDVGKQMYFEVSFYG